MIRAQNSPVLPVATSDLRSAVLKISDLPALPSMLANLTALIQDPRSSADQIGQMLSSDPTLVSKVLKLVNSAFYGFPGRVGTVTQAVSILGFSSIRNIVLTTSVMRMWPGTGLKRRFDLDSFWRHSLITAALSKALALENNIPYMEELFIAGLLHDIGRLVLSEKLTPEFERVLDYQDKNSCSLINAERAVLTMTHAEVGAFLAEKWNLPFPLVEVIRCHHSPETLGPPLDMLSREDATRSLGVVRLADELSRLSENGEFEAKYLEEVDPALLAEAGCLSMPGPGFVFRAREEMGRALAFLSV